MLSRLDSVRAYLLGQRDPQSGERAVHCSKEREEDQKAIYDFLHTLRGYSLPEDYYYEVSCKNAHVLAFYSINELNLGVVPRSTQVGEVHCLGVIPQNMYVKIDIPVFRSPDIDKKHAHLKHLSEQITTDLTYTVKTQ